MESWNEAYVTVESYFCALGLQNKWLLGQLIQEVLERARERVDEDPQLSPPTVAMEETILLVADWFSQVTDVQLPGNRLAARGRLALFLSDFPSRYPEYFLAKPPLPMEPTEALRQSYKLASPKLQRRTMAPKPIALNPLMKQASRWWEHLNHTPIVKSLVVASFMGATGTILLFFFWR